MTDWISDLKTLTGNGDAAVLVSVVHTAGSTPREAGARMCVTADAMRGTVGGGRLEFEALRLARERLAAPDAGIGALHVELFGLGPRLEQCCGGVVHLAFETITAAAWPDWLGAVEAAAQAGGRIAVVGRIGAGTGAGRLMVTGDSADGSTGLPGGDEDIIGRARELLASATASDATMVSLSPGRSALPNPADALIYDVIVPETTHIVLLGAGHVARALAPVITAAIPCRLAWADSRADQFPESLPPATQQLDDPAAAVRDAPPGALYLIMTHSHDIDQQLTEAILRRGDARYVGLIGSRTKRARFLARFKELGLSAGQIAALTCPIGLVGINGKKPGAIAVAVVAQLLQLLDDSQPRLSTVESA